ncbi:MAG: carboxymuconolactone decarboxylase family protein [Microthrixaceae bacterium]|mgnify:FL=1|nr:carboxymuconolactone decarboxylase family protein [Microthrixaceae bacterium]
MTDHVEPSPERSANLQRMGEVYGWEMTDGTGDFFSYTVDHLFGEIWNRPGLDDRARRLLLIGLLIGSGQEDVLDIQFPAALSSGDFSTEELREIVILACHYAGWPRGGRINTQAEKAIHQFEKKQQAS